jgi:hypothetical protein
MKKIIAAKWYRQYLDWCREKGIDPNSPDLIWLGEEPAHLQKLRGLTPVVELIWISGMPHSVVMEYLRHMKATGRLLQGEDPLV